MMEEWLITQEPIYAPGRTLDAPLFIIHHCIPSRIWRALIV